jgi:hypothetical protein
MNPTKQHRSWYKKWWGITLAIPILPLLGIWYVWVELERSKAFRLGATAFLLAIYAGGIMSLVYALPNNPSPAKTLTAKHTDTTVATSQTTKPSNTTTTAITTTPTQTNTTPQTTSKATPSTSPTNANTSSPTSSTGTNSAPSTSQPTTPTPTTPATPTPPPQPTVTKTYQCWYTVGSQYSFYLYMVHVTYYSNGTQSSYQTEVGYNSSATGGFPECPGNTAPL